MQKKIDERKSGAFLLLSKNLNLSKISQNLRKIVKKKNFLDLKFEENSQTSKKLEKTLKTFEKFEKNIKAGVKILSKACFGRISETFHFIKFIFAIESGMFKQSRNEDISLDESQKSFDSNSSRKKVFKRKKTISGMIQKFSVFLNLLQSVERKQRQKYYLKLIKIISVPNSKIQKFVKFLADKESFERNSKKKFGFFRIKRFLYKKKQLKQAFDLLFRNLLKDIKFRYSSCIGQ